jgi:hypothetical protein
MMWRGHRRSAVEIRKEQINGQLARLRFQLALRDSSYYTSENAYLRQSKRARDLIALLEGELLMLDCPGEYDELPAAVVADELGLTYEQVRSLIRLGEIAATGRPAHERICRRELERITTIGPSTLLHCAREEAAEIFEQALPQLQSGDLAAAKLAYRRLDARESWCGPHAPAFLVGLELATGEFDGALSSVRLMCEHEDPLWRAVALSYLGRVLRGMEMKESGAQGFRDQLLTLADRVAATRSEREGRGGTIS